MKKVSLSLVQAEEKQKNDTSGSNVPSSSCPAGLAGAQAPGDDTLTFPNRATSALFGKVSVSSPGAWAPARPAGQLLEGTLLPLVSLLCFSSACSRDSNSATAASSPLPRNEDAAVSAHLA